MVDARPRVTFLCDGQEITHRQMEALAALHAKGSMQKAAAFLDLSTPVLHKYVHDAEEKADASLVSSNSKGSRLTKAGLELLERFKAYELRLEEPKLLRVAGTIVTEKCLLSAATELMNAGRSVSVSISTDEDNIRLMNERRADCIVLDDPVYAMEHAPEAESSEIGSDMLVLKDEGSRYARATFGAQRLGFRYLKDKEIPYEIARVVAEPSMLDRTGLSYFANKSLVRNGLMKAEGARDQKWSVHSITALRCSEHEDLPLFVEEASEAWLYRKG